MVRRLRAGSTPADLVRGAGVGPDEVAGAARSSCRQPGKLVEVAARPARSVLLHADRVAELEDAAAGRLGRLHEQYPLMTTHDRQKVLSQLDYVGDEALVQARRPTG